jgi:hypothetical protein
MLIQNKRVSKEGATVAASPLTLQLAASCGQDRQRSSMETFKPSVGKSYNYHKCPTFDAGDFQTTI